MLEIKYLMNLKKIKKQLKIWYLLMLINLRVYSKE